MPKNKTLDSTVKKSKVKSIGDFVKKYTAVAHIGDLHIMLSRVKFTKRQIKNYKKHFNIDVENLEDKKDA